MMNEGHILMCLISFILGYLVSRHMSGNKIVRNGFTVAAEWNGSQCWVNNNKKKAWNVDIRPTDPDDCSDFAKSFTDASGGSEYWISKWTDKEPDQCYVPDPDPETDLPICKDICKD